MPLYDHFRPPISLRRHWHAFHNAWATYLSANLNQRLPEGYFAEPNVQFGIEIDVAAFEDGPGAPGVRDTGGTAVWTAPPPSRTIPFLPLVESVEILVYSHEAGPVLVGAVELVSPGNKDRLAARQAFVTKCAAYLQQGIGLVIVDVVTGRKANLHADLLRRLGGQPVASGDAELYAVAYRAIEEREQPVLQIWEETLALGRALPALPLWLRGDLCLPVELDATYERTCREHRLAAG